MPSYKPQHLSYSIRDLSPYIHWSYFFHAWNLPPFVAGVAHVHHCVSCETAWTRSMGKEREKVCREALSLFHDAQGMLQDMADRRRQAEALFMLCEADSEGEDITVRIEEVNKSILSVRLPFLRQQNPSANGYCQCLSDFVRPKGKLPVDHIGLFATTMRVADTESSCPDPYEKMLRQTLSDRLAEAAAERLHEEVRKSLWGYAKDEQLTIDEMLAARYQGIRPAVGYPCMPDLSLNKLLADILHFDLIGISLTENGMMEPHASVSGLMISHPQAEYFSVGKIGQDQLKDYASRRGLSVENLSRFLAANISHSPL